MKRFLAVFHARNIEFVRDRTALAWTILLPFFLISGFAFIFDEGGTDAYKVGVYGDMATQRDPFYQLKHIEFIQITDLDKAIEKVRHHQLDMVMNAEQNNIYWINKQSSKGYLIERLMWSSRTNNQAQQALRQTVEGREIRYLDWVLPGILGMNMMFGSLFGVGFVLVRYRKNGVLKRLKATPLTAIEFLCAQVLSRLLIALTVTTSVFAVTNWIFDIFVVGSYFAMFLVFALGTASLISLGLMLAARIKSEELVNGVLNLLSFPMLILSGVWFSLEGAHPVIIAISKILPLTHMLDAIRAIMIDGASLLEVSNQILILTIMSIVFLFIGTISFKWD
ncbi:MAG: ABC transporter permease [Thiohalomonadales bacterium]